MVLRHDHDPARAALGRDLARICRARRLTLVVAGDGRLAAALKAGVHLRGGYWPEPLRPTGSVTSSAHSVRELKRAQRAGAELIFVSPAFPTASHAGAPGLGPLRWAAIARRGASAGRVAALGGVDGSTVKRLPRRWCRAIGAIGALAIAPTPGRTRWTHTPASFSTQSGLASPLCRVYMTRPIEHRTPGVFVRGHMCVDELRDIRFAILQAMRTRAAAQLAELGGSRVKVSDVNVPRRFGSSGLAFATGRIPGIPAIVPR